MTATPRCPACDIPLTTLENQPPWCERCEWNLEACPPLSGGWLDRYVTKWDHRAGFRADATLASRTAVEDLARPRLQAGQVFLRALSAALLLLPVGALATAGWLLVTQGRKAILLAVPLAVVAILLRPLPPAQRASVPEGPLPS